MIDDKKIQAITMIIQGEQITDIAKFVGVNRSTIYNWLDNEEFKNELDTRRREIVTQGNNLILSELGQYVNELKRIALTGRSEKVRSDTAQYLVNRVLGTPTNKIEQTVQEDNKDKTTNEDILAAIDAVKDQDKE